jgi:tetratricopeptide (TPR) repeat protein
MHGYDRLIDGGGTKNATFRWRAEDAWSKERSAALVDEVRAFAGLRSSSGAFPLRCYLASTAQGVVSGEVLAAVSRTTKPVRDLLTPMTGAAPPAACVIRLSDQAMVVDLCGVTAATLHYNDVVAPSELPTHVLAHDALVLLALALANVGQAHASGRVTALSLPQSSLAGDFDVSLTLSVQMARARMIPASIAIFDALDQAPDARAAAQLFFVAASLHGPTLSDSETSVLRDAVRRRVERRESSDPASAAADLFNLANMERGNGELAEAQRLLDRAVELDPAYSARPQWWVQKGQIASEQGAIDDAVKAYGEASRLDPGSFLISYLYVDELLVSGDYAAALGAIPDLSTSTAEVPYASHLRTLQAVARIIVERCGLDRQARDHAAAHDLDVLAERELAERGVVSERDLMAILQRDALSPLAWGLLSARELACAAAESFDRLLVAAWTARRDTRFWVDAIAAAVDNGPLGLVPDLAVVGDDFTDGDLLPLLAEATRAGPLQELVEALETVVHGVRREREGSFVVRLIETGEAVEFGNVLWSRSGERSQARGT